MELKANGTWKPFLSLPVPTIGHAWAPVNETWSLCSWDPFAKKYVPDSNGSLRKMGYADHIEAAPARYSGPLPSFEAISYVRKCDREHQEWVARRAAMIDEQ